MNKEVIKIPISQELANYINKLIYELNNKSFIMVRLFEKHKDDKDCSMLKDKIFTKHHKELEMIKYEYDTVRSQIGKLTNLFLTGIGYNPEDYEWSIDNFVDNAEIVARKFK